MPRSFDFGLTPFAQDDMGGSAVEKRVDLDSSVLPSDTKSLPTTTRVRNEEDTGGTPAPGAYFLVGGKVCKESPRNFRMFLGLFRRPKEEADKLIYYQRFLRFPLGNPQGSAGRW